MRVENVTDPVDVDIEYRDLTDDLIRDRIVVGLKDQTTRSRLLRERNLTLDSAIALVRTQEMAEEQQQQQQMAAQQSLMDQAGQMANAPLVDPTKNASLNAVTQPPEE